MLPYQEVCIYSITTTIIITLLYRVLVDQKEMKKLKHELNYYQKRMKQAQKTGKKEDVQKFLCEMTKLQKKQFALNIRPMMISMFIFVLLFLWIASNYSNLSVKLPIPLPYISWDFPIIHITREYNWFWWYFILILLTSFISRKLIGIQ